MTDYEIIRSYAIRGLDNRDPYRFQSQEIWAITSKIFYRKLARAISLEDYEINQHGKTSILDGAVELKGKGSSLRYIYLFGTIVDRKECGIVYVRRLKSQNPTYIMSQMEIDVKKTDEKTFIEKVGWLLWGGAYKEKVNYWYCFR